LISCISSTSIVAGNSGDDDDVGVVLLFIIVIAEVVVPCSCNKECNTLVTNGMVDIMVSIVSVVSRAHAFVVGLSELAHCLSEREKERNHQSSTKNDSIIS
jgi:hypothetical protein